MNSGTAAGDVTRRCSGAPMPDETVKSIENSCEAMGVMKSGPTVANAEPHEAIAQFRRSSARSGLKHAE